VQGNEPPKLLADESWQVLAVTHILPFQTVPDVQTAVTGLEKEVRWASKTPLL
jgi:hypothetical protein